MSDPVRPVKQRRSAETRERLLDAVESYLESGRFESATISDIVRRAGCSVGAFYGRFTDKDAAIAALYARRRAPFIEGLRALAGQSEDLEAWARGVVDLALDHATRNRALLAQGAVSREAMATIFADERVASLETVNVIRDVIRDALIGPLGLDLDRPAAAGVASFALAMIGGMTRDAAVFSAGLLGAERNREWFAGELAAAVSAYARAAANRA